jgi:nicotinamide phosphoribosyltransferase
MSVSIIYSLFATDSYKLGHAEQYPEGTELVYSNWTPRDFSYLNESLGEIPEEFKLKKIPVVGLKAVIMDLFEDWKINFFQRGWEFISKEIDEVIPYFHSNPEVFKARFLALHKLGYLPLTLRAMEEGSLCEERIPMLTIENSNPEFFWLTNFMETSLSANLWLPLTSAATASVYRQIAEYFATKSGCPLEFVDWQIHDFSLRGMSNIKAGAFSGLGHLHFFKGTDNVPAVVLKRKFYNASGLIGGSVPATEHSVMCCGSTLEGGELSLFRRLITETYPSGVVSIVSDTWDYWKVLTEYARLLKNEILGRKEDALGLSKVVFRPDSGDPEAIICGDHNAPIDSPEYKGSIQVLWEIFGGEINEKGYKVLSPRVGLIYGDSITPERCYNILKRLTGMGFSTSCVVFGVGSYTYQYRTRDSLGFALKTTACKINGQYFPVFKQPKGCGFKSSAKGFLTVTLGENGKQIIGEYDTPRVVTGNLLKRLISDGRLHE